MKGKIEMYFNAPNIGKLRTRLENPSKELSQELRVIIAAAAAEVCEQAQIELKAKILKRLAAKEIAGEIRFNNPTHRAQSFDITSDIFTVYCSATREEFEKRFPPEKKEVKKADSETAEDTAEEKADEAEKKPAKKAVKKGSKKSKDTVEAGDGAADSPAPEIEAGDVDETEAPAEVEAAEADEFDD